MSISENVLALPPARLDVDDIKWISSDPDRQRCYYERHKYWVEHQTLNEVRDIYGQPVSTGA